MAGSLAALVAAAGCAVLLFAWSGAYNVAASRGHWYVTDLFLRFGMENSVRAHAPDITPPRLDDPDLVRLGAGHYLGGCAFCHAAPGQNLHPVVAEMLPAPPDLQERAPLWPDQELFWIVKNGLKYAGMPAWPVQDRDDEVWAVVAFLRRMPHLDAAGYAHFTVGMLPPSMPDGHGRATVDSDADSVGACARCHGAQDTAPTSDLVPRLHGQPVLWLSRVLQDYARGDRHSGIMQPLASGLSPRAIEELAAYYGSLAPLPVAEPVPDAESVSRGRHLAENGDATRDIPACMSCHGAQGLPSYPRLSGQSGAYIAAQLNAWRHGKDGRSATHAIMAPIARRLDDGQVGDVAAFFASTAPSPMQATAN